MIAARVLFIIQGLIVFVLLFGDIGFDKPGGFGLDFDSMVRLLAFYAVCLIAGLILAVRRKHWRLVAGQLLLPIAAYAGAYYHATARGPKLFPHEQQHLVGMTKAEVAAKLSANRRLNSGVIGQVDFEVYNGIRLFYSPTGRVKWVTSQDDYKLPAAAAAPE